MPLNLKSVANGSVILTPASTAVDKNITLPATDGTMVVQDGTNTTTVTNLAVTNVTASGTVNVGGGALSPYTGFVNRIINGNMVIAQRGTAAVSTDGSFPVDRWYAFSQAGAFIAQQVTDVPVGAGFTNSILWSPGNTTARTYSGFEQRIEGFNVSDLDWGSASAKPITVSFWVKAGVTATLSVTAGNSASNRNYPATYTVNAANTWEYKTITIPGDTSGTWLKDNGSGLRLWFTAGGTLQQTGNAWGTGGSASCATGTTALYAASANFWITGVQLEKGSTATPFEFRSIGTELALCQRYYQIVAFTGTAVATGEMGASCFFKVTMRANPSLNSILRIAPSYTGADNFIVRYGVGGITVGSATFGSVNTENFGAVLCTGLTVGGVYGGSTLASAEL